MATDARGHTVPAATDAPKRADLTALSLSVRDVVYVATVTARAAAVTALGASAANPLYVHRGDAPAGRQLEVTTDGTTWRVIAADTMHTESGVLSHAYGGGVGPVTSTITFAQPFTAPPAVTLGCNTFALTLNYSALTAAGVQIASRGFNGVAPPASSYSISWIASGP